MDVHALMGTRTRTHTRLHMLCPFPPLSLLLPHISLCLHLLVDSCNIVALLSRFIGKLRTQCSKSSILFLARLNSLYHVHPFVHYMLLQCFKALWIQVSLTRIMDLVYKGNLVETVAAHLATEQLHLQTHPQSILIRLNNNEGYYQLITR